MPADHARLISNLLRYGHVVAVDAADGVCRVESGELTTGWVPWFAGRAGRTRTWSCPSIGEQVLLVSPEGELANAIAVCGIYSTDAPAPAADPDVELVMFGDGAVVSYDAQRHALAALLPSGGTANITADGGITLNGPLTVNGETTLNGATQVNATVKATDTITSDTDVLASNVSLKTHRHLGVQAGGSTSGPPQ